MTRYKKRIEKIESKPYRNDISYKELDKYLNYYEYRLDRTSGSHHSYLNNEKQRITFPVHDNKIKPKYVELIVETIKKEKNHE